MILSPVARQAPTKLQRAFSESQRIFWVAIAVASDRRSEQMDAEGLGRGLLLTPLGTPPKVPKKQTAGTVMASHKMLSLQALSSSLNAGTAKRGFLGQGKAFGWPPAACPPKRPRPFARCRAIGDFEVAAVRVTRSCFWMQLFCLQLEGSCLQWSFFTYSWQFSVFAYSWTFSTYSFSFFAYSWSFFAYSGKVRLIRTLRDCKQRSSTVSKKAPTVSKKASPRVFLACLFFLVLGVTMVSWLGFGKVGRLWQSGQVCCFLCCLSARVLAVCVLVWSIWVCMSSTLACLSNLLPLVVVCFCVFPLWVISWQCWEPFSENSQTRCPHSCSNFPASRPNSALSLSLSLYLGVFAYLFCAAATVKTVISENCSLAILALFATWFKNGPPVSSTMGPRCCTTSLG